MKRNKDDHRRKSGKRMMTGGLLLIAAAFFLTGFNLWDEWRAGKAAGQVAEELAHQKEMESSLQVGEKADSRVQWKPGMETGGWSEVEIPDYILNPDMEMPVTEIDGNDYIGVLEIPSLELSLPVISQWSYPRLRIAPCRYTGSAYKGNLVIAAHNYSRHFGRIGTLSPGEQVSFTDVDGNYFAYQVVETQMLEPEDIEDMIEEEWDLTLFTCTIGGKTRVTVRCEAIE